MRISIIAAMADNRIIGRDNKLPWKLPADLKRFKDLTMGHHIIMGRKTFDSIGRPLPGRTSIVITRQEDYRADGCLVAHSLKGALELSSKDVEPFVVGGAEIYRQALQYADRIYLTVIHKYFDGDAYFPKIKQEDWELIFKETHKEDEKNPYSFSFLVYKRL